MAGAKARGAAAAKAGAAITGEEETNGDINGSALAAAVGTGAAAASERNRAVEDGPAANANT
ncbi:hypothetical protein B2J93_7676 [Marssonina coronariae]|uniref:Uncharacterized protein n=1 Tax=Diplocarpon coronariae TaxID=2795749 RepID=A0A218ZGV7_9HELO|nr:hypothetical protein B2J93_7676 [Marssonina coronariae]